MSWPCGRREPNTRRNLPIKHVLGPRGWWWLKTASSTIPTVNARAAPTADRPLPFSVAFSDSDEAGAKQQTVIATSPVRWNRRETFGELIRLPSNSRRFPLFGEPM